ncbi:hypothetical protein HOH45_04815 [bacterium]|jgi:hypothetical protein|nr:hypothetical protein [bacterium]
MISILANSIFLGLVIFLFVFLYLCLKKTTKNPYFILSVISAWLLITATLSINGFFMNFGTMPPRILFAVFPVAALLIYIAFSSKPAFLKTNISQTWLINIQSFRIVMEVILWLLAKEHIAPELLTWNGHNFDIIAGVSAPFIAYYCFTSNKRNKKVALVWNGFGMLLLVNVFAHGLLSAPTPFQGFFTNPSNTFVATFPYIWLPAFVVPCAFLFHILSIRKILNEK